MHWHIWHNGEVVKRVKHYTFSTIETARIACAWMNVGSEFVLGLAEFEIRTCKRRDCK